MANLLHIIIVSILWICCVQTNHASPSVTTESSQSIIDHHGKNISSIKNNQPDTSKLNLKPVPFGSRSSLDDYDDNPKGYYHHYQDHGNGQRRGYNRFKGSNHESGGNGNGKTVVLDSASLHEHKQREVGEIDHDSHGNQDKYDKMVWDKGDGFVKRWHWDRGEKLKRHRKDQEMKHFEKLDKGSSNELIERQKGQISRKLKDENLKSFRREKHKQDRENELVNSIINNHSRNPNRGSRKNSWKSGHHEDSDDDDDRRRAKKYRKYKNPHIVEHGSDDDEDDEERGRFGRRKVPSKRLPRRRRLRKQRYWLKRKNMVNLLNSDDDKKDQQEPEVDDKISEKEKDGNLIVILKDKNEKRRIRLNKNKIKSRNSEGNEDEEERDNKEDKNGDNEEGENGEKKVKNEKNYQRKVTLKEEKSELKAVEHYNEPKKDSGSEEEEDEEQDHKNSDNGKDYVKKSKGSGYIHRIRSVLKDNQKTPFEFGRKVDRSKDRGDNEDTESNDDQPSDTMVGRANNEVKYIQTAVPNNLNSQTVKVKPSSLPVQTTKKPSHLISPFLRPLMGIINPR